MLFVYRDKNNQMPKNILFFMLVSLTNQIHCQNLKIFGYVKDSLSGETLVGANIFDYENNHGAITNNFGFYSFSTKNNDTIFLRISYVGYKVFEKHLIILKDTSINFYLMPQSLKEVEIKSTNIATIEHSVLNIPVDRLKSIPTLAGETDLMKALTLLPGIAGGTEGTSNLYIRGSTPDQNLILIDGSTVYNTSHLFGFFSVFNPTSVKTLNVYKGGFPARFGGRLSSILDVTMKEGNNQKQKSEISIGILNSSFATEGPIKKDKSSYFISGRFSYLSLLNNLVNQTQNGKLSDAVDFFIYDFNAKVNFELTKNQKLFVSSYFGRDAYDTGLQDSGVVRHDATRWGNETFSMRYTNIINSNFFFNAQINHTNYYLKQIGSKDTGNIKLYEYSKNSNVRDYIAKLNLDYIVSNHILKFGAELGQHHFAPNNLTVYTFDGVAGTTSSNQDSIYNPLSAAMFIEDNYSISKKLSLNFGLRAFKFFSPRQNFTSLEPRLLISVKPNTTQSLDLSFTKMSQCLHLLTTASSGASNDVWVPATFDAPMETSWQVALSLNKKLSESGWVIQLETYFKHMDSLIDYRNGVNIFAVDKTWEQLIEKDGIGRAYGAELLLKKDLGRVNGWISYTLSWSERKFDNINSGTWYYDHYDRRHNFNVVVQYALSSKWTLNTNFVLQSGYVIDLPEVIYYNNLGYYQTNFISRNNARTKAYQRLDIGLTKIYKTKNGNEAKWIFSLYNAYGYNNPFSVSYEIGYSIYNPTTVSYTGKVKTKSIFNFIPGISYSLKFK